MWRLSNMLFNNISEEINGGIKKYMETNETGYTTFQNVWDAKEYI